MGEPNANSKLTQKLNEIARRRSSSGIAQSGANQGNYKSKWARDLRDDLNAATPKPAAAATAFVATATDHYTSADITPAATAREIAHVQADVPEDTKVQSLRFVDKAVGSHLDTVYNVSVGRAWEVKLMLGEADDELVATIAWVVDSHEA